MSANASSDTHPTPISIHANELPLYCPGPKAPLWSSHPRVYIEIETTGEAICPYCSAHYVLEQQGAGHESR